MRSATLARLESLLQARKLDGTLQSRWGPDSTAPVCSTGNPLLDAALGGGWRAGELSEVAGGPSSGRTSLLIGTLAAAAERGPVALVDTVDRFDPSSAARAGLKLARLLWVRGPAVTVEITRSARLEPIVHQAVRAFDLIVRAGGFAVVALDLADVPIRCLHQLPAATWMRIARANEGRPTACLLIGPAPIGRSARGISVVLEGRTIWRGTSPQSRQFLGFEPELRKSNVELRTANGGRSGADLKVGPSIAR
jgi:hypothetical protein